MTRAERLPRALTEAIITHAQQTPEVEVCGLVTQATDGGLHRYPVANVAAEPATRFEMDPREQIDAMRAMRERGQTLLAIYHSHPDGPPRPSEHDRAELGYPDALQLIVSLQTAKPELRAWRLIDGELTEVPLEIVD